MHHIVKHGGVDVVTAFNAALDAAYDRRNNGAGNRSEPYFVRELISEQTIRALNTVSVQSYDSAYNVIKFRAGFLHGCPYARFTAEDAAGATVDCRRELADALLVLYMTAPDGHGAMHVVRRAACMLMFKVSNVSAPLTPAFAPKGAILPAGTDEEQFYLFNEWPTFELQSGSKLYPKRRGLFSLPNPKTFDMGKFAVLWDHASGGSTWVNGGLPTNWLFENPLPSAAINAADHSLGNLLDQFIAGKSDVGRTFDPAHIIGGGTGWNELMGTLLGYAPAVPAISGAALPAVPSYLQGRSWDKQRRDVNPARLGFLAYSNAAGALERHAFFDAFDGRWPVSSQIPSAFKPPFVVRRPQRVDPQDGLPMLVATIATSTRYKNDDDYPRR